MSDHELGRLRQSAPGTPKYFAVHNFLEFDREPDSAITAEMIYYRRLPRLSVSNQTNELLERAPDAYLYGALLAAEPFLLNDERIETWQNFYLSARDRLKAMDRAVGGPLVARVQGATP